MGQYILGIDQGTSSSRAIIFDTTTKPIAIAQHEYNQIFPQASWVEQNPQDIWQTTYRACQQVLQQAKLKASDIAAIGITNQRETTFIWDKNTGEPIYHAIGWQDSRTAEFCQQLQQAGHADLVRDKTGLLLNPYFSASKIKWLLDNVSGARKKAERGELLFGTVDTFLLWHLTGGVSHKTDATNASRTLLYNIHTQQWDAELLKLFSIPEIILPEVCDNSAEFGSTAAKLFDAAIPITGMVGDQQGALFGQTCFSAGMAKSTYGTGAFIMINTGTTAVTSANNLLTTIAYRLKGKNSYAIEGSIFVAGAAIKWLRDQLKIIDNAQQIPELIATANAQDSLYFVPSFTGLGAPYWDPNARAGIFGLTLETGRAEIVRALIEGCCFATKDVIEIMQQDSKLTLSGLHVDGGMASNDWLLQFLADILNIEIKRPIVIETTALGAVYLAGLYVGAFKSLDQISTLWHCDRAFKPNMSESVRSLKYQGWQQAIKKTLTKTVS